MVEFHVNDDDEIIFPLSPPVSDKNKKMRAIMAIMKTCYETGLPPVMNTYDAEDLVLSVKDEEIKKVIQRYQQQVPQIAATVTKETDVMYFLAASSANNGFPVLPMMVDCFTFSTVYNIFYIYNINIII